MKIIRINALDNVAVALENLEAGCEISAEDFSLVTKEAVPAGHKVALKDIASGEKVIKYGNAIGVATMEIKAGSHVHTHNMKTGLGDLLNYSYSPVEIPATEKKSATFMGYERKNGKAGIRNDIWIIPTVGCVNDVAKAIERESASFAEGSVENVIAFRHPYGCSQMGEDQEHTRQILANLINHPNAGGVLVLGLGCENSNIDVLKGYLGEYDETRVEFLVAQEYEDEIGEGVERVKKLIERCKDEKRVSMDASKLVVGLKCGGSDGFSGITANPLVGKF